MPATLSLVPHPDPLGALRTERHNLAQRLADLQAAASRVRAAEGEEATVLAEISALGERHVQAIREWAQAGGGGEMPAQDPQEAHGLAQRLLSAQTQARAAAGALGDLEAAQRDLAAGIAELDRRIADRALSDAVEGTASAVEHARAHALQACSELAKVYGLAVAIRDRAARLQGMGRGEEARPLFQRAEQFARSIPRLEVEASTVAVEQEAAAWRARLAKTTGGVL